MLALYRYGLSFGSPYRSIFPYPDRSQFFFIYASASDWAGPSAPRRSDNVYDQTLPECGQGGFYLFDTALVV